MSCNIRCQWAKDADGPDRWEFRRDFCAEVIRSRRPDVVCLQEAWREQLDDLLERLPGFEWFGLAEGPENRHPLNAILFRREGFRVLSSGGCWLSETPHVPASKSWDSACIRMANWMRLEETASGGEVRIINTHLDHISQLARENQARLIAENAAAFPETYPQILTGDLNSNPDNPVITSLTQAGWKDTWRAVHPGVPPGRTYHEFVGEACASEYTKIDWILTRGPIRVKDVEILRDCTPEGRFASDHYFLLVEVVLPRGGDVKPFSL
jgi:endonuclease/exonuclease/phosphatase family metal-dependent hydrolase